MIAIARTQNAKLTKLTLGQVIVWFSYETPVAYSVPGIAGVVVSDKGWTETTRRHIGSIEGRRTPIRHEDFERGLQAIQDGTAQALGAESTILKTISKLVDWAYTAADKALNDRIARMGQS